MSNLSCVNLKTARNLRDHEERQRSARHRTVLVLMLEYLRENALLETADTLLREARSLHHHDIAAMKGCDNMDLDSILLEYECAYLARLQKKPKFIREMLPQEKSRAPFVTKKSEDSLPMEKFSGSSNAPAKCKKVKTIASAEDNFPEAVGVKIEPAQPSSGRFSYRQQDRGDDSAALSQPNSMGRLKAALESHRSRWGEELYELALTVSREMFLDDPNVRWHDIKGMEVAKRLVKEAVVYPVKYPDLFQGILTPWRGLLLTGPPGN